MGPVGSAQGLVVEYIDRDKYQLITFAYAVVVAHITDLSQSPAWCSRCAPAFISDCEFKWQCGQAGAVVEGTLRNVQHPIPDSDQTRSCSKEPQHSL